MKRTVLAAAVAAGFTLLASPPGRAQTPPAEDSTKVEKGEKIVVKGQFIDTTGASAMKSDIPARDTPFTVSNYTDAFMKSIETTTVSDLYSYMTGIQRSGNTGYDLNIRGFTTGQTDKNAIVVNGLPGLSGRFGSPPVSGTDHIELIKGAAGVLYGQTQPGGFVNIITKKPEDVFGASIDMRGSTYAAKPKFGDSNGFNGVADLTGPIDKDGTFQYRLIGEKTHRDLFRTDTYEHSEYFTPSLKWVIGPRTSALVQVEYRHAKTSYDQQLVIPNREISRVPQDIRTHYQEPSDYQEETGKAVTLSMNHAFAGGIKVNAAVRSVRSEDDAIGYDSVAVRANLTSLQRRARNQHNERTYDFYDANLNIPFATGFVTHQALVGANGGKDGTDFDRIQFFNGGNCPGPQCLDIDIYNPVYGVVPALSTLPAVNANTPGNLTHRITKSKSNGVYASDLMTFSEQWKASVGVRRTKESQRAEEVKVANVPTTSISVSDTVPMAGIIFQPTKAWSLYASLSTSFVPPPSTAQDVNGQNNTFEPEKARQVEVGVKGELMGGRFLPTLAIYRIRKENALSTFACSIGTCSQQVGEQEAKGLEFEMDIRLVQGLQTAFGYAFTDAKVLKSADASQVGARLANSAKHVAHIWTRYSIPGVTGLSLGVGAFYNGDRVGNLPAAANRAIIQLPAYSVLDVGAYYTWDRYNVAFKVGNVTNRRYFESAGFTADVQILPGAPRNLSLSLRTVF